MPWLEPVSTAISGGKLVYDVMQSSSVIRKHAKRLAYRVKHGTAVVPVFGAGGVGKSTAAKIIAGGKPLDMVAPYDESMLVEEQELIGDIPGRLLAAPGQEARVERHWPKLFETIHDGTAFGVINVVAYGYHSFGIESYKEHQLYMKGMTEVEFLAAYLVKRQAVELDLLKKLFVALSKLTRPFWMVTLVTKQDLWWPTRQQVREYYESGPYSKQLATFVKKHAIKNFQHEFLPLSFVASNMKTATGEMLAVTASGYDTGLHLSYLQNMFTKVNDLLAQGAL